jgi:spoIIIJ-associated protein
MMTVDRVEETRKLVDELIERLGIEARAQVDRDEETGVISVEIEGEDLGVLIGRHGETLQALQLILALMLHKTLGEWQQIVVDVDGWRDQREQQLRRMARRAAEQAIETGEAQTLPPMVSFERRIIHLELGENSGVVTESSGTDPERFVVVRPV